MVVVVPASRNQLNTHCTLLVSIWMHVVLREYFDSCHKTMSWNIQPDVWHPQNHWGISISAWSKRVSFSLSKEVRFEMRTKFWILWWWYKPCPAHGILTCSTLRREGKWYEGWDLYQYMLGYHPSQQIWVLPFTTNDIPISRSLRFVFIQHPRYTKWTYTDSSCRKWKPSISGFFVAHD